MKALFVDTGAFVAKEIANDQHHSAAGKGWNELSGGSKRIYSSEHVFDESLTLIARRSTPAWAADWGSDALDCAEIEWLSPTLQELRQGVNLMRKYADQRVSFTDCLSFILMKRIGIRDVFGFDRHFNAAGFRLWPEA